MLYEEIKTFYQECLYFATLKEKSRVSLRMSRKVWNRISKTLQKEGMIEFKQFWSVS